MDDGGIKRRQEAAEAAEEEALKAYEVACRRAKLVDQAKHLDSELTQSIEQKQQRKTELENEIHNLQDVIHAAREADAEGGKAYVLSKLKQEQQENRELREINAELLNECERLLSHTQELQERHDALRESVYTAQDEDSCSSSALEASRRREAELHESLKAALARADAAENELLRARSAATATDCG